MTIHIFYRHYNINGSDNRDRPEWFDFEKCFVNLLDTINGKSVRLHLIMDGGVENNFINKYRDSYILHSINAGNDHDSFWKTWEIVKDAGVESQDLIYFLENDYLHTYCWVDKVLELYNSHQEISYVSLYDHNDKYTSDMYTDLQSRIITTQTHHWRTTPSTCGSFIIKKNIFEEDYHDHVNVFGDHQKFLDLTKNKNRFVLTPMPGLSTHCMNNLLSPTIDWKKYSL